MANILDYVAWRGDLSFKEDKVHVVDGLIFSLMVYIDYRTIVSDFPSTNKHLFKDVTKDVFAKVPKDKMVLGVIVPTSIVDLTYKASHTDRFGNVYVSNMVDYYNEDECCQFAAITYHFGDNCIYICFRGTDDTLIGWQENLNMICDFPVKAQSLAVEYVNKVASLFPKTKIYISGHSKGGNLANYAGIYCDDSIKKRIVKVYNFDGPGFVKDVIDPVKFEKMKSKLHLYVPRDDVVGMLFEPYVGNIQVVPSNSKGIFQHDGCSWQLMGHKFLKEKDISENSKHLDIAITELLNKLDDDQRKELANEVYEFVRVIHKTTLTDLQKGNSVFRLLRYLGKISSKNKLVFMDLVFNFIRYNQL